MKFMPMLDEDAYRYAIRNAHAHSGKAEVGALIGKLKALHPQTDVKQLVPIAQEAVARVNSMDSSAISGEYTRFESEGFELHIPEKKGGLEDLAWADHEPVNTRYAPNPSAPGHLGHLRPALLSHRYASKYGGTFLLRFDDTDPKLKKPIAGGEQMYLEDLAWFGIAPDQVVRASDRLGLYHDYMRQLVGMGHAYVCTCAIEGWRKLTLAKKACPCREEEAGIQSQKLEQMLTHSFKQGEAVLRIKTDLTLDDPSQRDWWAARIVDNPHHYRVKDQYLWPSYNFASAIDDHVLNITLIIRGQEHYQNMLKQKWVYTHFGWAYPHSFHHGRLLMTGTDLSKSKMLEGILNGKYTGWDDPRLFTIRALHRKGFHPKGIEDLILDLGVKPSDTHLDLQLLATFNKPYVENSPSIPFIQDPIQLNVDFVPQMEVEVDQQTYTLKEGTQSFLVPKSDLANVKMDATLRLRGAYIVKINQMDDYKWNAAFVSTAKIAHTHQVPWLIEGVDVEITMPDATIQYGVAGPPILNLQVDDTVYFPHRGYGRIDSKADGKIGLWFTHP